ncbi:MAG: small multi-drug export protein [Candidatus Peregrinibacteria bacterium]|nr:small multi-drug export protein [Candidatus Peregrinibacteria bacterium]
MSLEQDLLNILITVGIAMLPILEVRGAIPFALGVLGMPLAQAFFWAVLGNILIVAILLKFLDPVTKILMKHSKWFDRFLTDLFHKTRHKHSTRFNEAGAIFLIGFVAIPLPITGAWTGSLVAFLFGVRFWPALTLISIGIVGAATLISLGFESITTIIDWFLSATA